MKLKFNFSFFVLCFLIIQIIIHIKFPNIAYALSPEDLQEISSNSHSKDIIPKDYGIHHMNENDAYALNQKSIYFENKPFLLESNEYPIILDSLNSKNNNVSKTIEYKSKFLGYVWKKYSNEFESFDLYKKSINNSFSIRNELKKTFKNLLNK